jgi:hypothetical protein
VAFQLSLLVRLALLCALLRAAVRRDLPGLARAREPSLLHNVCALIARSATTPRVGAAFKKNFPSHGWFSVTVSAIDDGGEAHVAHEDGNEENITKEELKNFLVAYGKEF